MSSFEPDPNLDDVEIVFTPEEEDEDVDAG